LTAISARSSTILVGLAILVHSAILVQSDIPEASAVPIPKSPHFTPATPTVLTPTAPIPVPMLGQTMVSLAWLENLLRYRAAMTPQSCVPSETLITHEVEPVLLYVS
jgi:hypothetical protein